MNQEDQPLTLTRWLQNAFEAFKGQYSSLKPETSAFGSAINHIADTYMITAPEQMIQMFQNDPSLVWLVADADLVSDQNLSPMGVFQVVLWDKLNDYIIEQISEGVDEEELDEEQNVVLLSHDEGRDWLKKKMASDE